jgi:hypothetical protein
VEASKQLAKPRKRIPSSITRLYSNTNFEAFGLLCFAVHNWDIDDLENAGSIFNSFLAATIPESEAWIGDYKPLATDYHGACNLLAPIEEALRASLPLGVGGVVLAALAALPVLAVVAHGLAPGHGEHAGHPAGGVQRGHQLPLAPTGRVR